MATRAELIESRKLIPTFAEPVQRVTCPATFAASAGMVQNLGGSINGGTPSSLDGLVHGKPD